MCVCVKPDVKPDIPPGENEHINLKVTGSVCIKCGTFKLYIDNDSICRMAQ